jgi:hypothetical protein
MPDTTITVPPFIFKKPKIALGVTGTSVDIACGANAVTAEPEQDENTVETFCGTYTSYKPEVWTITITAVQSFGAVGTDLWSQVRPLCGTVVPFALLPDASRVVGPDNPEMRGNASVKGFPFLDGAVGEASEFDLELAVQGVPTFSTTVVGTEEGEPEPQTEAA